MIHNIYIKFQSEKNYELLKFSSHIITYQEVIDHLIAKKNIKIGNDKDHIELIEALKGKKFKDRDSIDPGWYIIAQRLPGYLFNSSSVPTTTNVPLQMIRRGMEVVQNEENKKNNQEEDIQTFGIIF